MPDDPFDKSFSVYRLLFHSRDQMYMNMKNFLTSRLSDVHSYVISGRMKLTVYFVFHFFKKCERINPFLGREFKKITDMSFGDNQSMALTGRRSVPYGQSMPVLIEDLVCRNRAKWTIIRTHLVLPLSIYDLIYYEREEGICPVRQRTLDLLPWEPGIAYPGGNVQSATLSMILPI